MIMSQQVVKNKFSNTILYLFAFSIMFFTYKDIISPLYGYMNFDWNPNSFKFVESIFLIIIISVLLPTKVNRPSDFLIHLLFLFPILPMIVLYGAENNSREFLYSVVLGFTVVQILRNIKLSPLRIAKIYAPTFSKFLLIISWSTILIILALGGTRYFNLNIFDVYEYRTLASKNLPSIFLYILPVISKVALPSSLLISIHYKNKFLACLAILGSVIIFGLTSNKGPLFFPLITLAVYFIIGRESPIKWLIVFYILTLILSYISFFIAGLEMFGSMIVRRSYLIPAELNYLYFEFFSSPENNFFYWSDSRITAGLYESPNDFSGPRLIGMEYFRENSNANTGMFGSGYMQAGYVGMMIYVIILSFIFMMVDSYSKVMDTRLIVPLVLLTTLTSMISSDMLVSLLTHGLIYCVIILTLIQPYKPK